MTRLSRRDAARSASLELAGCSAGLGGSADRRVRLWTPDGPPLATLRMQGPVRKVLLSDDERSLLVLVEGERAVRRWRLDVLFQEWRALGLGGDLPVI